MHEYYGRQVRIAHRPEKVVVEQFIFDSWCVQRTYPPEEADKAAVYAGRLMNDVMLHYGRREE